MISVIALLQENKSKNRGKGKLTKPAAPASPELTLTQMMGDPGKVEDVEQASVCTMALFLVVPIVKLKRDEVGK